ncbi:unnamed protein product [Spirodela intermedia]|nr:unnamed protein product [Spirodela intermedia]
MLPTMYLANDAKLWWRTRTEDRPAIETWEEFIREL